MSAPDPKRLVVTITVCGATGCEKQLAWYVDRRSVDRAVAARILAMPDTRLRASHGYCRECMPEWMKAHSGCEERKPNPTLESNMTEEEIAADQAGADELEVGGL